MHIDEKKIYLILSPHINYYHSYRGDSKGATGFGKDIRIFNEIFEELEKIEQKNFSFGQLPISWDYGDIFWSIQLQKEFQNDTLDTLIERCKQGIDEVLIGSWGNCAQAALDTEELIQDHHWFLHNSMGTGVDQLFPGRVAPYVRAQETMFTQGMIELYNKLGIEGICLYYSMYGFDVARPYINPRLDWNQRYGLVRLQSTLSNESTLMIPMYGFGDRLDFCSTKKWLEFLRKKQENGVVSEHALIFFNFDMDSDNWINLNLPKFLKWMPNSRGLMEFAEAVDKYEFVEFANLIDLIPNLKVHGKAVLREDVADGMWNGFYNWAQKYNNTTFWTYGQRARWLKCASDSLISNFNKPQVIDQVNNLLRNVDDSKNTYLKNKILFASTTNFGMAMPFLHPDRFKTALKYVIKAYEFSEKAINEAIQTKLKENVYNNEEMFLLINPITIRGISENEIIPITSPILLTSKIPKENLPPSNFNCLKNVYSGKTITNFRTYKELEEISFEAVLSPEEFRNNNNATFIFDVVETTKYIDNKKLTASQSLLQNEYLTIEFDTDGKIKSFQFANEEFACPKFLESSITFGKTGKIRKYSSSTDKISVLRNGSDGFSAVIKIESEFEIIGDYTVKSEKKLTLYSDLPYIIAEVSMDLPDIKGESSSVDGSTYYVDIAYDERWQEVMPCEIRPQIHGVDSSLNIWKKNFFGIIDYFRIDMKEVDPRNANIDCLVANISDGWMAVSNRNKGLAIGFNSLKAANFAFSPIKVRDKGFGDLEKKAQQVRINPFGTYYGEIFKYWSDGNGHAQKLTSGLIGTNYSTAPTYSGKKIIFELALAPYIGDRPPAETQNFLDHFSLRPIICIGNKDKKILYNNYNFYTDELNAIIQDQNLEEVMQRSYLDWVRFVNENYNEIKEPKTSSEITKIGLINLIRILIDGIKGR